MQSIHYDAQRDLNAVEGQEWAQFCDADKCGIVAGSLGVGCLNPNAESTPPPPGKTDKLDCPTGHVVEVLYAHWDHIGVQSLDEVTCKRALPPLPIYSEPLPLPPLGSEFPHSGTVDVCLEHAMHRSSTLHEHHASVLRTNSRNCRCSCARRRGVRLLCHRLNVACVVQRYTQRLQHQTLCLLAAAKVAGAQQRWTCGARALRQTCAAASRWLPSQKRLTTVSYTHLTLPTKA